MFFIAVTVIALLGTLFGRTFLRFKAAAGTTAPGDTVGRLREYSGWLGDGIRALFEPGTAMKARSLYRGWVGARYPGWRQWVFAAMAASFALSAGTGLFFALFIPRGMFGLLLLGHVMSGGLFAVSLAAAMLLRAGAHRPDAEAAPDDVCAACPVLKSVPRSRLVAALFWAFAASGFVLIVTALLSMLPYLRFGAQAPLLEAHRYGALAALLSSILFFDLDILPRRG